MNLHQDRADNMSIPTFYFYHCPFCDLKFLAGYPRAKHLCDAKMPKSLLCPDEPLKLDAALASRVQDAEIDLEPELRVQISGEIVGGMLGACQGPTWKIRAYHMGTDVEAISYIPVGDDLIQGNVEFWNHHHLFRDIPWIFHEWRRQHGKD